MVRTMGKTILKFLHAPDFFFKISKCKLRLLEPLKQPHLKMKMFFESKTLTQNNEKYLVNDTGKNCFIQFSTRMAGRLLLTFCLQIS